MNMAARGFTLIEMVVTLAIMAILVQLAQPAAHWVRQRHQERDLRIALETIRIALDAYKAAADAGRIAVSAGGTGYPPSLEVLVQGVADQTHPKRARLIFLRRIPPDPMNNDPALQADPARTWGLRSYASPPQAPAPGTDVFDVYSRSMATGLNGVPYRQW
jgi:general secretion pathway protein G